MQAINDEDETIRIIVVGDNTVCKEGLCRMLAELPHTGEVQTVPGMDGLKEQLAEGRFDLIFLVLPPGTDYGASVRSVKSLGGRTPVAVLALVDTPSAIHSVIEAGASGFLPSMSPPQAIAHAVELMRSGGVYLPPSIFRTEASRPRGHDSAEPGPMQVTRRQRTVLRELAKGQSNKQIGVGPSGRTVGAE